MNYTTIVIAFALMAITAACSDHDARQYRAKAYDENCKLIATGILNLRIGPPDDDGRRKIEGDREFFRQIDQPIPFREWSGELEGSLVGDEIRLNLDRNIFDSNTYVSGRLIDQPEPGFEGRWTYVGWGLGPAGHFVAARTPAKPTLPCVEMPATKPLSLQEASELGRLLEEGDFTPQSRNQEEPSKDQ